MSEECTGSGSECDEAIKRLYYYLDGELTDARRLEISSHLDDCGHCLDAYDFEADLRKLIANKCKDVVPGGLKERIADAIRHDSID